MIFMSELDNMLSIHKLGFLWLGEDREDIWKTDFHEYVAIGANWNHIERMEKFLERAKQKLGNSFILCSVQYQRPLNLDEHGEPHDLLEERVYFVTPQTAKLLTEHFEDIVPE